VETRRLSFDLLHLVLLPSLSIAFSKLGSAQYRDYCMWCVLVLEHWKNTPALKWLYNIARDYPADLLCRLDIENLHADYTKCMKAAHQGETEMENTVCCAFMLELLRDLDMRKAQSGGAQRRAGHSSKLDDAVAALMETQMVMFEKLGNVAATPEAVKMGPQQRQGKKTVTLSTTHP